MKQKVYFSLHHIEGNRHKIFVNIQRIIKVDEENILSPSSLIITVAIVFYFSHLHSKPYSLTKQSNVQEEEANDRFLFRAFGESCGVALLSLSFHCICFKIHCLYFDVGVFLHIHMKSGKSFMLMNNPFPCRKHHFFNTSSSLSIAYRITSKSFFKVKFNYSLQYCRFDL